MRQFELHPSFATRLRLLRIKSSLYIISFINTPKTFATLSSLSFNNIYAAFASVDIVATFGSRAFHIPPALLTLSLSFVKTDSAPLLTLYLLKSYCMIQALQLLLCIILLLLLRKIYPFLQQSFVRLLNLLQRH